MKKILIAIPTNKYIEPDTYKAIYDLIIPEGFKVEFQFFYGYQIDQIRNLIAHWGEHYDYLFSVDSDISFDKDTLSKMLGHDKDIVSGLYIQRIPGTHSLEVYEQIPNGGSRRIPWEKIKDHPLVEIVACGMGCALIKSKVLKAVGYPYYTYHSALDHNNTLSEDVDFCRKARGKGFKIWADTTIRCKHTGNSTFEVGQIMKNRNIEEIRQQESVNRVNDLGHDTAKYKTEVEGKGAKDTRFIDKTAKAVKRVYPGIDPETGKYALEVNEGEKFTGDSVEYTSLAEAVQRLKHPIGASVELGVRLGLGSKTIIDAYRHYHPKVRLNHLGIDPYGNIDYAASDSVLARKFNYDNLMRKTTLINFAEDYPEFHLVNFEDSEFFNRFHDGYPVYEEHKHMISKYELVHYDGPHDTKSVLKEAVFFNQRKADQTVWIFDDITGLRWDALAGYMNKFQFQLVNKGENKAVFEYNA
tara:strand:- start:573 stop:1982 length:1410 start_codon:yes stop_codon:yes gene_type:complete